MNDNSNQIVVNIAKELNKFKVNIDFEWTNIYLRFVGDRNSIGSEMIFQVPGRDDGKILRMAHSGKSELYDITGELFCDLQDEIEKEKGVKFCVAVLKLTSDLSYDIYFEYNDMNKWALDKMDGKTGIPDLEN